MKIWRFGRYRVRSGSTGLRVLSKSIYRVVYSLTWEKYGRKRSMLVFWVVFFVQGTRLVKVIVVLFIYFSLFFNPFFDDFVSQVGIALYSLPLAVAYYSVPAGCCHRSLPRGQVIDPHLIFVNTWAHEIFPDNLK